MEYWLIPLDVGGQIGPRRRSEECRRRLAKVHHRRLRICKPKKAILRLSADMVASIKGKGPSINDVNKEKGMEFKE